MCRIEGGREAGREAGRQAGRQAGRGGREAGRQGGGEAGRQAGRQAGIRIIYIYREWITNILLLTCSIYRPLGRIYCCLAARGRRTLDCHTVSHRIRERGFPLPTCEKPLRRCLAQNLVEKRKGVGYVSKMELQLFVRLRNKKGYGICLECLKMELSLFDNVWWETNRARVANYGVKGGTLITILLSHKVWWETKG